MASDDVNLGRFVAGPNSSTFDEAGHYQQLYEQQKQEAQYWRDTCAQLLIQAGGEASISMVSRAITDRYTIRKLAMAMGDRLVLVGADGKPMIDNHRPPREQVEAALDKIEAMLAAHLKEPGVLQAFHAWRNGPRIAPLTFETAGGYAIPAEVAILLMWHRHIGGGDD